MKEQYYRKRKLTPLGKYLRTMFIDFDLTVGEAATLLGMTSGNLSNVLHGNHKATVAFVWRVKLRFQLNDAHCEYIDHLASGGAGVDTRLTYRVSEGDAIVGTVN